MRYKNQLPEKHKTWLEFYKAIAKDVPGSTNETTLRIDVMPAPPVVRQSDPVFKVEIKRYEIDVDYMKARAFEEVFADLPTQKDVSLLSERVRGLQHNFRFFRWLPTRD